jgi:dipeptidase E
LHHLKLTGADRLIKEHTERGRTLVGISAGTVVLGHDIHIVNHFTPEMNHLALNSLDAIGLYEQTIFPHYRPPNKFRHEKPHEVRIQEFERLFQRQVERLTDDEAIYVNGEVVKIITEIT